MVFRNFLAATALAVLALPASASPLSSFYSSFWVLGDSLSDNGNLYALTGGTTPTSPPYYDGRFSNGPVWDEGIASDFATTKNFAFGGALASADTATGIPGLASQVGYLSAYKPVYGGRPLASILIGANDMFAAISDAAADQSNAGTILSTAASAAVASISSALDALGSLGIKNVEVWNLPDLGATPALNGNAGLAYLGSTATSLFNSGLSAMLAGRSGSGQTVGLVNLNGLLKSAETNPGTYGYTDVSTACVTTTSVCAAPDSHLFWDSVHPTEPGQQQMADLFAQVTPVPLPATGLLLIAGMGCIGTLRRRRRAA